MAAMLDRLRDLWTERPAVVAAAVIAPIAFVITLLVLFLAVGGNASGDQQAEAAVAQAEPTDQAQTSVARQTAVVRLETQSDDQQEDQQDVRQAQREDTVDQPQAEDVDEQAEEADEPPEAVDEQAEEADEPPEEEDGPLMVAGYVVVPLDEVLVDGIDEEALQHGSDGSEGGILPIANGVVVSSRPEHQTAWELLVPSAGLKSNIVRVGKTHTGAMGSPDNPYVIGWLDTSAEPGETGNILLAGHRDFEDKSGNIGTGVCWELVNTVAGDQMIVRDTENEIYFIYTVTEAVTVNPRDRNAARYLRNSDERIMTLITCTGAFNAETHQYSHRFVVVGVLAAVASPDA